MKIVTVKERKAQGRLKKVTALERIVQELTRYAREHGGRYLLYGSGARGELRHDSDFDFLVDFPLESQREALKFLEGICAEAGQVCDVSSIAYSSERFLARVLPEAKTIA